MFKKLFMVSALFLSLFSPSFADESVCKNTESQLLTDAEANGANVALIIEGANLEALKARFKQDDPDVVFIDMNKIIIFNLAGSDAVKMMAILNEGCVVRFNPIPKTEFTRIRDYLNGV